MKRGLLFFLCCIIYAIGFSQPLTEILSNAISQLQKDEQFKHAIISMYVVESKSGTLVYDKNSQLGLAPASCQKLVISASAFELLGKHFSYKTSIYLDTIHNDPGRSAKYNGLLIIRGSGDPTLGSWRYPSANPEIILEKWCKAIRELGLIALDGSVLAEDADRPGESNNVPDGYIWQDIGNYYATTASLLNWKENQYDIRFRSGSPGTNTTIISIDPPLTGLKFNNEVISGENGSGDNAYIYCAPYSGMAFIKGTIPPYKTAFTISGSMPDPVAVLDSEFNDALARYNVPLTNGIQHFFSLSKWKYNADYDRYAIELPGTAHYSPELDSINYWFLKKSVNLYGESLVKTIGKQKTNSFSTAAGLEQIKKYWKERGIEPSALHIIDGCGLSPANRVTTSAMVSIIQFASRQDWFPSFYEALPEINGLKMKDGYIGGVRSFTGYVKNKNGREYSFSFIVNNFDGSAATVREKMWKVLDILK